MLHPIVQFTKAAQHPKPRDQTDPMSTIDSFQDVPGEKDRLPDEGVRFVQYRATSAKGLSALETVA